jgi:hypothetical protein
MKILPAPWLCLSLALSASLALAQPAGRMPTVSTRSLAGAELTLPRDLPGERTLVMIGFEFDHQKVMDEWNQKMNLQAEQREWVQLHGISRSWSLISGFINDRKRPSYPDAAVQARTIPVYTDVSAFITGLGFADDVKLVKLAVVTRNGEVLDSAQGSYDAGSAATLLKALSEAPTSTPAKYRRTPPSRPDTFAGGFDDLRERRR